MAEFDYFSELKTSLEEAAAYQKGDKRRVRISVREIPIPKYAASDVMRVRSQLQLSQRAFAIALGVSSRTVESWESGRNIPNGTAKHLLYLMEQDHSIVDRLITR